MNKIIAAFDGLKYSKSTCDYATALAAQTDSHLVGVFLDDSFYTSYKIYDLVTKEEAPEEKFKGYEQKDSATRKKATSDFDAVCKSKGLEYTIHHDHRYAMKELLHESIYADLMLIDAKETLSHHPEKQPTQFIRDLLSDTQCPVLVVPQKYKPIQKIILLYDGEPSSVHAIKMFSYVFPQVKHLETEVISVKAEKTTLHLPDDRLMKEFMKRHFPKAKYTVIKGSAEYEILKHLKGEAGNALVVLGAYRRGTVSRWFRESMADKLMREVKLPLFIAHNK